ncbi:MAG: PilZ domain-containing protein [Desulforhopalus sp.]
MNHTNINHMDRSKTGDGPVKRKSRRARIPGLIADLADGNAIVGGKVDNISQSGFSFTHVLPDFAADKHTYTIVLSRDGRHYRIIAKPCWRLQGEGEQNKIGFKILDAPWEWLEFTMTEIPEFDYEESTVSLS